MREFNSFEERNIKFLVSQCVDFTLFEITATGLKKGILDATAPMRTYFLEKEIHDYSQQQQGQNHKQIVDTVILNEQSSYATKTSLYRPNTKKGDPRLWVYNLGNYTSANEIHAICVYNRVFYVINVSCVDIENSFNAHGLSPLRDFIFEFHQSQTKASKELLQFFQKHRGEWFEAEVTADTGIGRTIETMLGIPQNSNKTPDYKGIELKSYRKKRHSTRNALFTQVPCWELSNLKSSRDIVAKYGYRDAATGKQTYQNTVQCGQPNSQGLILDLNTSKALLELLHQGEKIDDVALWTLQKLHDRLKEKHRETFWIEVDSEYKGGREFFRYRSIEHTKNPILSQFDVLLESAAITLDLLLCRPSGHGDTFSFKINKSGVPLLFPDSVTYQLL